MADKDNRVHSDYWLEPEYGAEIGRLRATLGRSRAAGMVWTR